MFDPTTSIDHSYAKRKRISSRPLRIGIQPDLTIDYSGAVQSYSRRWLERAHEASIDTVVLDVYRPDWLQQLADIDGFMWRCDPTPHQRFLAKRLVPALEQARHVLVYPNWKTLWHLEDKVGQHYLLDAADIPTPKTKVFWDKASAEAFCSEASYPFVFKLAYGFHANNVRLIENIGEARYFVDQMFGPGMFDIGYGPASSARLWLRRVRLAKETLAGRDPRSPTNDAELQHGYFYAQEFLPANICDTRVVVIGERAYSFRRRNRPGDFRASGSGIHEFGDQERNLPFVRLAFQVAAVLDLDTVSIDGLERAGEPVVGEIGSAYPLRTISSCPGHWVLTGSPTDGNIDWREGKTRPEEAWFHDFLTKLEKHRIHRE